MDSIDEGELVLTLTENATTVIKSITGADATPSEAGVRISQQDPSTAQLALNTAEAPIAGGRCGGGAGRAGVPRQQCGRHAG